MFPNTISKMFGTCGPKARLGVCARTIIDVQNSIGRLWQGALSDFGDSIGRLRQTLYWTLGCLVFVACNVFDNMFFSVLFLCLLIV